MWKNGTRVDTYKINFGMPNLNRFDNGPFSQGSNNNIISTESNIINSQQNDNNLDLEE